MKKKSKKLSRLLGLSFVLISHCAMAVIYLAYHGNHAHIKGKSEINTITKERSCLLLQTFSEDGYKLIDSIKLDKNACFSYRLKLKKKQPEFAYLFHNDKKIASLILQRGMTVELILDSSWTNYSIVKDKSQENIKLKKVEDDFAAFLLKFKRSIADMSSQAISSKGRNEINKELSKQYIDYYRSRVKYVVNNSNSLSCIPVLLQEINDDFPIFSQSTDIIYFQNVYDSLKMEYPNSAYVRLLEKQVQKRRNSLRLNEQLKNAQEVGFPDLNISDINGEKQGLSKLDAKLIILEFMTTSDARQNILNKELLAPLYEKYHSKGLEIYQVSLDEDKNLWANTVKAQDLKWICVNDGKGLQSPIFGYYNITSLPSFFIIKDGILVNAPKIKDAKSFEAMVAKYLNVK